MSATILFPILIILAALIMAVLKIGEEAWSAKHWVILLAAIIICVASLFSFFALRKAEGDRQRAQSDFKKMQSRQSGYFDTMTRLLLRPGLAPDDSIESRIGRLIADQTILEKPRTDLRAALEKARTSNLATMANQLVIASIETQVGGVNSRLAVLDSSMLAANSAVSARMTELNEQFNQMGLQLKEVEKRLLKTNADSTRASKDYLARLILKAVYALEEH